ncbi:hypothetical protein [Haloferax denitrificans]|uniref:Transmembrane transport protein n=1 Tax=Haloferax denitrificans ATCC 35960 TaxID=662478 RepID=M0JC19_9EURY|nr:hypothetical protein [Haloferax denitrificans]EMA06496.1 transmembrane transport protein [Haloferax denitrificans ATCC 35960]
MTVVLESLATLSVLALGTAQRNISAALVVVAQNFQDPDVLTTLLVGALVMLAALMVAGGELGKRTAREQSRPVQSAESAND